MKFITQLYIAAVCTVGMSILALQFIHWESRDIIRFGCYLGLALLSSGLKIKLPGVMGTMSVNFLFALIGIVDMGPAETVIIGCIGTFIQCAWKPKSGFRPIQACFSVANMATSIYVCDTFYHWPLIQRLNSGTPILLMVTALLFFVVNTGGIALVISLTERSPLAKTWHGCYFWAFPFYLLGASIAWMVGIMSRQVHWQNSALLLPFIYFIYRAYRVYLGRLEDEKKHVEEMAGLHLRTIEALALAIEAKDHNTHEHLRRVRTYAVEIGKEMGLAEPELEALRAAALLHDIGKLAVPEHIISKPGKLNPEEFEKMKIHPTVGAEILERVQFPYPVVPIVRSHHEKWDGSGYPAGLRGEEIPLGARILTAVDCLDALASDRQYRRALPLDKAMEHIERLAGKSFDPRVVAILTLRYPELEQLAKAQPLTQTRLSMEVRVPRGQSPAAGFETSHTAPPGEKKIDPLSSIAAARQEVQLLFELTRDLGTSLSLDETISVVATRLKRMVPYDSIAVYVFKDGRLVPEYVNGENFRLFSSLQIPVGEGLSGWVAENKKAILNGNPSVESGYLNDPSKFSTLRSGLAVPLEGVSGVIGVLTLYRADKDAFSRDHLRILLAVSSKISLSVENALKFRQVENSAITDYLTGLANARSLFLRLDSELSRCERNGDPLTVLVCDLDGFKEINDRYGHLEGNKVLRAVADALRSNCREYDYVARMGGDEFVLLLPGTDRASIQQRIAELSQIARDAGDTVGVQTLAMSIGQAFYPGDGANAEQLLSEADRCMYKAKGMNKSRAALVSAADTSLALAG
jgi:diguanylate cyclase (GGDEF)-like protein/putative nucleotidyltransferase with HDIG domain